MPNNKIEITAVWQGKPTNYYGTCKITIKNLTDSNLTNPEIEFVLPEGSSYTANDGFEAIYAESNLVKGYLANKPTIKPNEEATFTVGINSSAGMITDDSLPTNFKIDNQDVGPVDPEPPVEDTEAPSVPEGIELVKATDTTMELKWIPSTDNVGVKGYRVVYSHDNSDVERYKKTDTNSIILSDLQPETNYKVEVSAFDAAGNSSAISSISFETIAPIVDPEPPVDPEEHNEFVKAAFTDLVAYPLFDWNQYNKLTELDTSFLGFAVAPAFFRGYNLHLAKDGKILLAIGNDVYIDGDNNQYYIEHSNKYGSKESIKLFRLTSDAKLKNDTSGEEISHDQLPVCTDVKTESGLYWGGFTHLWDSAQKLTCSGRVIDGEYGKSVFNSKGKFIISEGGASGQPLAVVEKNVKVIADEYSKIIGMCGSIDFDFEGSVLDNTPALQRHIEAIKEVEVKEVEAHNHTYTLPVDIDGLNYKGVEFVKLLKANGIGPGEAVSATFNFMVMELRGDSAMIDSCIDASNSGSKQIAEIYEIKDANPFIQLCPMFGANNNGRIYNQETHQQFLEYAKEESYAGMNGWSANRDMSPPQEIGLDLHTPGGFGRITTGHDERVESLGENVYLNDSFAA